MKTILALTVSVIIALNLVAPSAGGWMPASLDVQHAMESMGTGELILQDDNFKQFLPTKGRSEAVITICFGGNGKTGLLSLLKIQKSLMEKKAVVPSTQVYTKVVLCIVREDALEEPKTSKDVRPRATKLAEFQPIIDALQMLLPPNCLITVHQDLTTKLADVMKDINPEATAVNIDAKVGAGWTTNDIQLKLELLLALDKYLKSKGVKLFANDLTSGKGSKNEVDHLVDPTAVISANRVSELQRPQGLVLLDKTAKTQTIIQGEIKKGEEYMATQNKPTGKGNHIKVVYVSFKDGKTEEEVKTALNIVDGVPRNWQAAFDLLEVDIKDLPLPL